MSMAARSLDSYRRTQVQSATPLELVVMLYDGTIRFLDAARSAIERRDIPPVATPYPSVGDHLRAAKHPEPPRGWRSGSITRSLVPIREPPPARRRHA